MHHFYSTDIDGSRITLNEEESRHCIKVMRLSIGDQVMVFDGNGRQYQCTISETGKTVHLSVNEIVKEESAPQLTLTLAVSPTKSSDRMEWMLEKMVEIGLARIVFIKTEKGERSRLNEKRLMKKAVSALKQSGNLWLPEIQTEVKFKDFLQSDNSDTKFVAHCFNQEKTQLSGNLNTSSISVLIGPEGDFSQSEVHMASEAGYTQLSLGIPRYRTETAAVVACTLINHFCVTLAE